MDIEVPIGEVPEGAEILSFSPKSKDPSFEDKPQGSGRSDVWKRFTVSKLPNGKLHCVCPRCHQQVSSKVERLTTYCRKCVEGKAPLPKRARPSFPSFNLEEEGRRKVQEFVEESKIARKMLRHNYKFDVVNLK